MDMLLTGLSFIISAVLAGIMGFAIQRGATCTVAAMDEIVRTRTARRLLSMVEASLWVVGGLLIARALNILGTMPAGYAVTPLTVVGGVLLGIGAFINGACVFGAIARLGSGEWAYVVTPIGFYVGCATMLPLLPGTIHERLDHDSPVLQASAWVALLFVAVMALRVGRSLFASPGNGARASLLQRLRAGVTDRLWSPHAATAVIGVTFLLMLLLAGAWAYTDVLTELARGMAGNLVARSALLVALFGGAVIGGCTAGRFRSTRITGTQLIKCFAGGVLMGWGGLLIPGSNDGLILVGMPLLWPYAWLAFATMCASIGAAMMVQRALGRRLGAAEAEHLQNG